jgi:hypothetical protein
MTLVSVAHNLAQERSAIIHRFREKRKRRVWKKKIRYFCRKNLADRRVRVKGRFVKSSAKAPGSLSASSSNSSDNPSPTNTTSTTVARTAPAVGTNGHAAAAAAAQGTRTGLRPNRVRTSSGENNSSYESATDVSDLTGLTSQRPSRNGSANSSQRSAGWSNGVSANVSAKQALTAPGSDDEEDEDNDMEADEQEEARQGQEDATSMEVVIAGEPQHPAAGLMKGSPAEQKPPRRLKLVLTSSQTQSPGQQQPGATAEGGAALLSPSKLVFRHIKAESSSAAHGVATGEAGELSGVDLLASIAAKTASDSDVDGDGDDGADEEGDVFTADVDMLRLPSGKRIRRHSIAY